MEQNQRELQKNARKEENTWEEVELVTLPECTLVTLPECKFFHELSFLNSVGKQQESHSNFININETSVTET